MCGSGADSSGVTVALQSRETQFFVRTCISLASMAYQDVACAIPARMAEVTEDSSTSVFSDTAGTRQSAVGLGFVEGTIHFEADVTDASILAELGIDVGNLHVALGEAGTQSVEVAPGTLFAAPSPETQLVDGVFGRNSVVSETSSKFAVVAACTTADRVAPAFASTDVLVMGPSPSLHQRGVLGDALFPALPAFLTAPNSQLNIFGRDVNNPFARDSQYSREAPNDKPLLYFGEQSDDIVISKRLYSDLVESKQHAENMMMIISKLEQTCVQHDLDMQKCKVICKAACERVLKEREAICKDYKSRLSAYERTCMEANERTDIVVVNVRTQHLNELHDNERKFKTRELELTLEIQRMRELIASKPVPDDWFNDGVQSDVLHVQGKTKVFNMEVEPVDTKMSTDSFQSCGDFNSRAARLVSKYDINTQQLQQHAHTHMFTLMTGRP